VRASLQRKREIASRPRPARYDEVPCVRMVTQGDQVFRHFFQERMIGRQQ
jgi:hypothetical protein